jgi:predicted Ser/Thr protein kinase
MMRGKHSSVYLVGPLALKIFKPGFMVNARKEWKFLRRLRGTGLAPRPYLHLGRIIVMERIRGKPVRDMTPAELRASAPAFLCALHLLDLLGIQKEECHRPNRHFIMTSRGVRLIDFERARERAKPSNVTQFLQALGPIFPKIRKRGKKYKKDYDLAPILKFIQA